MKLVLVLLSAIIFSTNTVARETTKLSAFEQFEAQKSVILQDIKDDQVYSEISYSDANVVRDVLDRMTGNLEGITDFSEMTEAQRADLFNDQELVNTILTMAENDSRLVCRRSGTLGTNFKTTTCETRKNRRERQEADRMAIDRLIRQTPIISN